MVRSRGKKKQLRIPKKAANTPWWAWEIYTISLLLTSEFEKLGISQIQFAIKSGVCSATVSRLKNGLWQEPRLSTVMKVAKALGYEVKVV